MEKQASETHPTYNSGRRGSSPIDGGFSAKPTPYKSGSIEQSKVAAAPKEVSHVSSNASSSHHHNIICHKCGGRGHMKHECSNQQRVILVDAEYISESEDETPKLVDEIKRGHGDTILCYPRDDPNMKSLLDHKVQRDDKTIVEQGRRQSIFQTACTIKV